MATKPFRVEPFADIDKWIEIRGPDYLSIRVDFDDVNHAEVRKQIKQMVAILNDNWKN